MEKIAFISGGTFIYWSSVMLTLAVVTAIAFYASAYLAKGGKVVGLSISVPVSLVLGLALGRLIHWYSRTDAYASFTAAMTDFSTGCFALAGGFVACIVTASVLRLLRVIPSLPKMLDAMAIGGGIGIAVGRLGSMFNTSCRGVAVPDSVGFPFAYQVVNGVSGVAENRLATFMLQSMATGTIVAALLVYMLVCQVRKKELKDGDVTLMFLLCYGAVQIICDSTRYDSLYLRSNGFISIVQILGLVAMLAPIVVFSVRMVVNRGFRAWFLLLWVALVGVMGCAAYMEYYVQRHGGEAAFAYSVMGICLCAAVVLVLIFRSIGSIYQKKTAHGRFQR